MTKVPRKPTAAPPPPRPKVPRVPPPPVAPKKRASTKSREEKEGREAARPRPPAKPRAVSEIEVELDLDGIELDEDEADEVRPDGAKPDEAKADEGRPDGARPSGPRLEAARADGARPSGPKLDAAKAGGDDLGWTPPAWLETGGADAGEPDDADADGGEAGDDEPRDAEPRDADAGGGDAGGGDAGGGDDGGVLDMLDLPASQPVSVPDALDATASRPISVSDALDATASRPISVSDALDATASRPISVSDDQLDEAEAPAGPPALSIAVHEEPSALATLEGVIEAAGHAIAIGASGKDGLRHVRHALAGYVDALIVGLPGGEPLIDAALALGPSRPVVIAAIDAPAIDGIRRATAAGADLALVRPHDADRLAPVLLAAARLVDEQRRAASARGAEQLLRARLDALAEPETGALQPYEVFHRVLEIELKRARRYNYPISVALFALELPPPAPPPFVRGILRARAGTALVQTIRDIDLATSLPLDVSRSFDSVPSSDERFLVLLPYTDLGGAAMLARRVIAVVAEGAPVVAAGRTFPPRFIGAVAGAAPGQALAFSRLMKEATRALEQARRDGAELAVPMPLARGST